jgi:restriction system protein
MPRRRKTSPAEGLMDVVALLPWWAGVALALASYFVLHQVAAQPAAVAVQPGQIGALVTQSIWRGLATAGQYALPMILLAGAGLSAWRQRERSQLVEKVTAGKTADALDGMTWQQFESLVGEAFRLQGYRVVETGGGGADGGVDLVLSKGGEKHLVQCKQWRAYKVGVDVVRELYGVMAARGAASGFVVTSGRFTEEALSFAEGRNLRLVDGSKLHGLIRQAQGSARPQQDAAKSEEAAKEAPPSAAPTCPACAKAMVRRTAKRGANAGGEFWGCTEYPACKGTRSSG